MRKKGKTSTGARFTQMGWCIKHLAYQYKVSKDGEYKLLYVDSMKQLKDEIATFELQLAQQYYSD